ncbi:helix-turn-helix transcriptional regulator [Streptomyces sp. NPDC045470]|uniref:helix-turn-helix domain-containing protein n=1 Tax=Streptomyces sp. NPDC045470 TaxID=3155469 RepID=UPI003400F306
MPELGDLAAYLRVLRAAVGLTYAALAEITNYSAATLKRAAAGKTLPAYHTALAYAVACEGPADETADLHHRAERVLAERFWEGRRTTVRPAPQFARDPADLSGALRDAYRQAGRPPLRMMEARAREGLLPRSSAHAIVNGRALPTDIRQYLAFLGACGINDLAFLPWFAAWLRVRDNPRFDRYRVLRSTHPTAAERLFIEWLDVFAPAASLGSPLRGEVRVRREEPCVVWSRTGASRTGTAA